MIAQSPRMNLSEVNLTDQVGMIQDHAALAAMCGYGFIDVWQAFWDTGDPNSLLVDGIHGNNAGYELFATVVNRAFTYMPGAAFPTQPRSSFSAPSQNLLTNGALDITATPAAVITDTFTRSTSNGWGTPDAGTAWTKEAGSTDAAFATNGTAGSISCSVATAQQTMCSLVTATNQQALASVQLAALPATADVVVSMLLRYQGVATHYRCNAVFNGATGRVNVQIIKRVANVETTLWAQTSGIVSGYTAGAKIWMAAEVLGSAPQTISMRIWLATQPDPVVWQATAVERRNRRSQGQAASRSASSHSRARRSCRWSSLSMTCRSRR